MKPQVKQLFIVMLLVAGAVAACAAAKKILVIERPETKTEGKLTVTSPAFKEGQPIPDQHAQAGGNASPALKWAGAPEGVKSYALIVEDPDAPLPLPFVHWIVYNLPATATALPEGVPAKAALDQPAGALQGKTSARKVGYFGPRPPAGPPHHYHFQVFALDGPLALKAGADRAALITAMKGHVLAKGEAIGTYQRKK